MYYHQILDLPCNANPDQIRARFLALYSLHTFHYNDPKDAGLNFRNTFIRLKLKEALEHLTDPKKAGVDNSFDGPSDLLEDFCSLQFQNCPLRLLRYMIGTNETLAALSWNYHTNGSDYRYIAFNDRFEWILLAQNLPGFAKILCESQNIKSWDYFDLLSLLEIVPSARNDGQIIRQMIKRRYSKFDDKIRVANFNKAAFVLLIQECGINIFTAEELHTLFIKYNVYKYDNPISAGNDDDEYLMGVLKRDKELFNELQKIKIDSAVVRAESQALAFDKLNSVEDGFVFEVCMNLYKQYQSSEFSKKDNFYKIKTLNEMVIWVEQNPISLFAKCHDLATQILAQSQGKVVKLNHSTVQEFSTNKPLNNYLKEHHLKFCVQMYRQFFDMDLFRMLKEVVVFMDNSQVNEFNANTGRGDIFLLSDFFDKDQTVTEIDEYVNKYPNKELEVYYYLAKRIVATKSPDAPYMTEAGMDAKLKRTIHFNLKLDVYLKVNHPDFHNLFNRENPSITTSIFLSKYTSSFQYNFTLKSIKSSGNPNSEGNRFIENADL
jgi:hypothetical protein